MNTTILTHLPKDHPWAEHILYHKQLPSTNDAAKDLANLGAPEGTICIAGSQSAGRGRMGRVFHSPENVGLYLSLVLRPHCAPQELIHLTCAVAVYVCDAIEEACGVRPQVKWINDLVMNGKKLGGILTELSVDPKSGLVNHAIIGIGINCNQATEDFPATLQGIATSLAANLGCPVDPAILAAAIINKLYDLSGQLLTHKGAIMSAYRSNCITIGQQVRVVRGDDDYLAHALDVDDDGALLVKYSDGTIATVNSGEVSVRGMYGYL